MDNHSLRQRLARLEAEVRSLRNFEHAPYRAVVEDMTDPVVRWRPDGTRVFVNDAYCRMFGATREELVGTSFWPLVAEMDREQVRRRLARLSPAAPISTGSNRALGANGELFWMEWTDRALFDGSSNLVEYQSVGRDITDRVEAERRLRRIEELDVVSRARAATAHDLANVFQVINFLIGRCRQSGSLDHRDGQALSTAARHGVELVDQLSDSLSGKPDELEIVDLNRVIGSAASYLGMLGDDGVFVDVLLGSSPCRLRGDPTRIEQVVLNLVRNSAEASDGAAVVTIETRAASAGELHVGHHFEGVVPEHCCLLVVRDRSGGVSSDKITEIFEPGVTTKPKGTGRGLATVWSIVRAFGGSIRVENVERGALFEAAFPAVD